MASGNADGNLAGVGASGDHMSNADGGKGSGSGGDLSKMVRDHDNIIKNLRSEVNQLKDSSS